MLHRYWFEFDLTLDDVPPLGTLLGCGVTAHSEAEAINIISHRVFGGSLPRIKRIVRDIDVSTLDQNHVVPNMGNIFKIGVWFPLGYEER
jgi:hypothetical protein